MQYSPTKPLVDGGNPFRRIFFAGGGKFLDALIAPMEEQSVTRWEWDARILLGNTSITQKRLAPEGMWSAQLLLLGRHVDLQADAITLPCPKLVGGGPQS